VFDVFRLGLRRSNWAPGIWVRFEMLALWSVVMNRRYDGVVAGLAAGSAMTNRAGSWVIS
jgi:hypothetical protein